MKLKVFEGFAGYGGASYGLKRLKENIPGINYEVVDILNLTNMQLPYLMQIIKIKKVIH